MRGTRRFIAVVTGVLGLLLVVRAVSDGRVWPLSIQLIAGVLLIVLGWLRWRSL